MHSVFRRFAPILCAAALCQCGAPQPPQCRRVPWASREPAAALLLKAHKDWAILGDRARQAEWAAAQLRYNAAVAKLFDQLRCGSGTWDQRAAVLGTHIPAAGLHETHPATLDAVFPAAKVSTSVVKSRRITTGVGVPLVGWKHSTPVRVPRERFLLPNGIPHILTATLDFNTPGAPTWHFTRRWVHEDLRIGRTRHMLAADWSAPNAFFWHMCDLDDLKIQNVIVPERYMEETGVYFVGPYDPEKIPLVFVHGLVSSPDAFKNMINELAPEPWFRAHYQIWLYNYPTGNPWLLSSMKFREVMRDACAYARTRGHDRNLKRMVVVAHSMGGLLTRSSVTDPKTVLYDARFKQPPSTLKVSATTRQLIRESLLYQPLQEPQRVVFLAVPHRGSPTADWRVSLWLSRLVRLPKTLTIGFLTTSLQVMDDIMHGESPSPHIPTSINSLSPNNKSTRALNQLPLPGRVTFHSIIGDRGRGDTPHSNDGVVPYGSSHVAPVASELIVPSNHSVPDNPEAARELKRILQLHLQDRK